MNRCPWLFVGALALSACGSAASPSIASETGDLTARAGDALRLTISDIPEGATVSWSGPPTVKALPEGSEPAESVLPQPGEAPAALWIDNPTHYSGGELAGVLFVLDPGKAADASVTVTASIDDGGSIEKLSASIPLAAMQAGEVTRGATLYADNCASCHGARGEGTTDYPGLNAEPDFVAADPGWTPALLAMSARADIDDLGVSLRADMPKWLVREKHGGGHLSGQDFADTFAWLKTQK